MSGGTEPVELQTTPGDAAEHPTLAWLDAISSGRCTSEEFLRAMREQFRESPDATWEVLSLLDQYYRRGKMPRDIFQTLKSRLEVAALGAEGHTATAARPPSSIATAPASRPSVKPAVSSPEPSIAPSIAPFIAPSPTMTPGSSSPAPPPMMTSAKPRPAAREIAIGDVLRYRYRVIRVLGRGGMGTVFEAVDEYRLDLFPAGQRIAIKVLHKAVAEREELLRELQREFGHLQSLSHPHIVRVHEFDRDGDIAFFTMELLSGALLSGVLNSRHSVALPRPQALAIIRDTGAALSYAHSRGIVHGDVNPQNIFLTDEGELRVLDFGAAHSIRRTGWSAQDEPPLAAVATLGYASCELLEGQPPDTRDDVFAFACVVYLLLSGKHPFPGCSAIEARQKRIYPHRPAGFTNSQWRVLRQGLSWNRERRPSDVQMWLDRLDMRGAVQRLPLLPQLMTSPSQRSNGALLAAVAVVLIVLLASGGYWVAANYDSQAHTVSGWHIPGLVETGNPGTLPVQPSPRGVTPNQEPATTPAHAAAPAPAPRVTSTPASAAASSPTPPSTVKTPATVPPPGGVTSALSHAVGVGPERIEMATVDVPATETSAHITVRRRGSPRAPAGFTWWTESGTAKAGVDFVPVAPHTEIIDAGSYSVTLDVRMTNARRRLPKSFYVVIDQAESGAALGARTLTMVTLQPPD
ncbi:MAG: protein kinase [Gammaproteobacteria bacterium]